MPRFFKPFSTLAVGFIIGAFVFPAVKNRVNLPGA